MAGEIVHFEVPAADVDRAVAFWSGLVVYHATGDVESSIAKVRELGGTADDKQPMPTHGWFASCVDTEGNKFSLWQADPNAA